MTTNAKPRAHFLDGDGTVAEFLLLTILLCASCSGAGPAPVRDTWLSYEPAVVELKGKLVIVLKYGPPNFGEDPERDEKWKVPILVLSQPINVREDPSSNLNTESFEGVREIQLVLIPGKTPYGHLIGKQVLVRGTLFQAHTAHHYTNVLMEVQSILEQQEASNRLRPGQVLQ